MTLTFPQNPAINDVYEQYFWNGQTWGLLAESKQPLGSIEAKTFSYDLEGRVTGIDGSIVDTAISYNPDGTVSTVTKTVNGISLTQSFGYDVDGNLSSITVS
jgi:antitoxin component YwqK of YwqJK toxin-antitoxin module